MTFTYQLTPKDFADGIKAHWKASFAMRWFNRLAIGSAVFVLLLFAFLFVTNTNGSYDNALLNMRPVAVIMAIYLLFSIWHPRRAGRKQYMTNPSAQGPIEVTVDDQGWNAKSAAGEGNHNWGTYIKWIETPSIFSLYSSSVLFHPIPKRALSPAQVEEFRALLKCHVVTRK